MAMKSWAQLLLALFILNVTPTEAQIFKKKKKQTEQTNGKSNDKKDKIKPYDKVITKEAKSDEGLFTTHQVEEDHFYEIPDYFLIFQRHSPAFSILNKQVYNHQTNQLLNLII